MNRRLLASAPGRVSVAALVDEQISSGTVDPAEVAAKVLTLLGPADLRPALEQTLKAYVHAFIGQRAMQARKAAAPQSSKSKASTVRDWWKLTISTPVRVGAEWKSLGMCSPADLQLLAGERLQVAAANEAIAAKYERLAEAMSDAGVDRVEALDRDAFQAIWQVSA